MERIRSERLIESRHRGKRRPAFTKSRQDEWCSELHAQFEQSVARPPPLLFLRNSFTHTNTLCLLLSAEKVPTITHTHIQPDQERKKKTQSCWFMHKERRPGGGEKRKRKKKSLTHSYTHTQTPSEDAWEFHIMVDLINLCISIDRGQFVSCLRIGETKYSDSLQTRMDKVSCRCRSNCYS